MGMGTNGGWNILAQGRHCKAKSVKTGESHEPRLESSHFPEVKCGGNICSVLIRAVSN